MRVKPQDLQAAENRKGIVTLVFGLVLVGASCFGWMNPDVYHGLGPIFAVGIGLGTLTAAAGVWMIVAYVRSLSPSQRKERHIIPKLITVACAPLLAGVSCYGFLANIESSLALVFAMGFGLGAIIFVIGIVWLIADSST